VREGAGICASLIKKTEEKVEVLILIIIITITTTTTTTTIIIIESLFKTLLLYIL
jgi:hypothetical protein